MSSAVRHRKRRFSESSESEEDFAEFAAEMRQFKENIEGVVQSTRGLLTKLGEEGELANDDGLSDEDTSDDEGVGFSFDAKENRDVEHEKKVDDFWRQLQKERAEKKRVEKERRREEERLENERKEAERLERAEKLEKKRLEREKQEKSGGKKQKTGPRAMDMKDLGLCIKMLLATFPEISGTDYIYKTSRRELLGDLSNRFAVKADDFDCEGQLKFSYAYAKLKVALRLVRNSFFHVERLDLNLNMAEQLRIMLNVVRRKKPVVGAKMLFPSSDLIRETNRFLTKQQPGWKPNRNFRKCLERLEED